MLDNLLKRPRLKSLEGSVWGSRNPTGGWNYRKVLDFTGGRCRFRTCDPRLV